MNTITAWVAYAALLLCSLYLIGIFGVLNEVKKELKLANQRLDILVGEMAMAHPEVMEVVKTAEQMKKDMEDPAKWN